MSDLSTKTAFNKENAPELLGQLLRVLKSQGMDDSIAAIKRCGLTRKLNDEWMDDTRNRQKRKRDRRASASRVAAAYTAAKVYSLRDFQRKAADVDKAIGAAYMEALGLKGMWDTFEAIPSKQEPLYDGNMKTMNGLRDAQILSGDVYIALKRYR